MHIQILRKPEWHSPFDDASRPMSVASQIRLRALYEYLDQCAKTVQEIRQILGPLQPGARSRERVSQANALLGRISLDADSWGHNDLYMVAAGLERFLMEARDEPWNARFCDLVARGLAVMSALVSNWDQEFRHSLSVGELLDAFNSPEL
jgi:hypothetical protein